MKSGGSQVRQKDIEESRLQNEFQRERTYPQIIT